VVISPYEIDMRYYVPFIDAIKISKWVMRSEKPLAVPVHPTGQHFNRTLFFTPEN
jgi:hypothetical protein